MGAVYRATHLGTTRPVALKVIAPQFMRNAEFVERFRREARAAGLLYHPNVVNVTDFGFADVDGDRIAYLVMEYLTGQSLAEVLANQRRLSLQFTVDTVEQIALAIGEAHKRGIIHRDLKPDNIWLEPNGRGGINVKVLDFGLAKLRDEALPPPLHATRVSSGPPSAASTDTYVDASAPAGTAGETDQTRVLAATPAASLSADTHSSGAITRVGTVLGTPLYMSPEQCRGEPLDERSDVYSLAVIVYQMLAGKPPYTGDIPSLISQHTTVAPPPFHAESIDVPEAVEAVVLHAMAKLPDDRPSSPTIFANELRVRSEGVGVILRNAVALYSEHFPTFVRLARFGYVPALVLGVAMLVVAVVVGPRYLYAILPVPIVVYATVYFTFTTARATFAVAMERILTAPLGVLDANEILDELARRLGVPVPASRISRAMGLYAKLLRLSVVFLSSPLTPGNILAIAVTVIEGLGRREANARSRELTRRLRHILEGIRATAVATFLVLATLLFLATFGVLTLAGTGGSRLGVSAVVALVLLSLNTIWAVPLVAILLTMLYVRARQAGGEEIGSTPSR